MKRFFLALILSLLPVGAWAQCNGVFAAGTVCGTVAGGIPGQVPAATITANPGGSPGQVQFNNTGVFGGLTNTQLTALVNSFSSSLSGSVPASGGGTTNFLRADGSFAVPPGTGGPGNVIGSGSSVVGDLPLLNNTSATALIDSGFNASQIAGLIPSTATVTITNASPGVVTWTAHGLTANAPIYLCTSGTLPTPLAACTPAAGTTAPNTYANNPTLYYVVGSSITANTFTLATTIPNANAGTAINTSSAGSGTHTAFANAMACAGCIGEYIYKDTPLTNGNVTSGANTIYNSLSLTAGIWEVGGSAGLFGAATTVCQDNHVSYGIGISVIATAPSNGSTGFHITSNNSNCYLFTLDSSQIVVPSPGPSTINFVCLPDFTTSTATCYGMAHARRIH